MPFLDDLSLFLSVLAVVGATAPLDMKTTQNTTKPGCPRQCGNLIVPYPFGVGLNSGCSLSPWYDISCNTSYDPHRGFSPIITDDNGTMIEVVDISDTQIRIRNQFVSYECYNSTGGLTSGLTDGLRQPSITNGAPYALSPTNNSLVVVGCNDGGSLYGSASDPRVILGTGSSSCSTSCSSPQDVVQGQCNRTNGCCSQAIIPMGARYFYVAVNSDINKNHTDIASWNPCGYAFVAAVGSFTFRGAADLNDPTFVDRVRDNVPINMDWFISNHTCSQAQQNRTTYACGKGNTICIDGDTSIGGYHCSCSPGYEGNPYLDHHCTDIDECADEQSNPCSMTCVNTPGGYNCSCPSSYFGDGKKGGTGCKRPFPKIPVALGTIFGSTILITCITWTLIKTRENMLIKRREKFFRENGGFLLKQIISSNSNVESTKIFTVKELAVATNNYGEDYIIGKGGYGTVYRGLLPENKVVAIKKSKVIDDSQIEQFINELVILARIDHRYIVKLLGCCLEAEIPLLVYEFISNGTLYEHIHAQGGSPSAWLCWSNCLRIATEAAKALAYLHSMSVIHRDIKSTNILLDDNLTAKISDFGISKLVARDQSQLSTLVQGTLGYLDPEYFLSSQLTNKSDVFSFGVVLVELMTGEAPISTQEKREERNLAMYFLKYKKAGRLSEIMDPQLVNAASQDELVILGELIQSCLSMKGKDRPTMKEVEMVLEDLYMQTST